jgi:mercuric reductase
MYSFGDWKVSNRKRSLFVADYDLIIIGSGAAGFSAAVKARSLGAARVAIIERGTLWGTCVNYGCVPSKFLITLADLVYYKNLHHPGVVVDSSFGLAQALEEKHAIIDRSLSKKYQSLVGEKGVEIITGQASFISPHELRVGERILTAPRFIIATGSSPSVPPVVGLRDIPYLTNIEALEPDKIPARLIVIGGRALGLEFAQLYAHLGSNVTVLQRSARIIPEEEPEISDGMAGYLREEGIEIRTDADIRSVRKDGDSVKLLAHFDGKPEEFTGDSILLATGRSPNTEGLGLENAGVETARGGAIVVDEYLRTSARHIWAAGDVLGEPQLEPAAKVGGSLAAENAIAGTQRVFNRREIPHAIFTTPQVASVGITEEAARRAGMHVTTRCTRMDAIVKSAITGDTRGMVKIVAEQESGRILGVHICASLAADMIQEGVVAVKHQLTVRDITETFHVFPTMTEILWVCARSFGHESDGGCDSK